MRHRVEGLAEFALHQFIQFRDHLAQVRRPLCAGRPPGCVRKSKRSFTERYSVLHFRVDRSHPAQQRALAVQYCHPDRRAVRPGWAAARPFHPAAAASGRKHPWCTRRPPGQNLPPPCAAANPVHSRQRPNSSWAWVACRSATVTACCAATRLSCTLPGFFFYRLQLLFRRIDLRAALRSAGSAHFLRRALRRVRPPAGSAQPRLRPGAAAASRLWLRPGR